MKKSLIKPKKTIILSVILLALFCINAFNSAHFSTAPTVSAEETTRTLSYYYLEDLGINRAFSNNTDESPLKWSAFQVLGTNGIIEEKTVSYADGNVTLKNYYNQISGSGGEFVAITQNSVLDLSDIGYSNDFVCIIDFYDRTRQTVNYILTFFSGLIIPEILFKDITIDGVELPVNSNDASINRFRFNGIQIYWIASEETGNPYLRNKQLQPTFKTIFSAAANGTYTQRENATITFANAYIDGYNNTAATEFKFKKLIAQISQISLSVNNNAVAIQQPNSNWIGENGENKYYLDYTPKEISNAYFLYNAEENNLKVDTDGKLYTFTTDATDLTELTESEYTTYLSGKISDNATDFLRLKANTSDSNYVNLLNKNQTGEQYATDLISAFKLKIKIDNYVEAPEPEPEPEPEPVLDFGEELSKDFELAIDNIYNPSSPNNWWTALAIAGGVAGPFGIFGVAVASFFKGAHDVSMFPRIYEHVKEEIFGETGKNIVQKIGRALAEVTKYIFNALGATLRSFLDGLGLLEPLQKFGFIALVIFGGLVSAGLLGLYIVKRKN